MRANSAAAFFTSIMLHGVAVGLVVLLTYYATLQESTPPVIFELVAGPPTAPDELVAPALGNSVNPVKLDLPQVAPTEPETVKTVETPPKDDSVADTPLTKPAATKPKPVNSIAKELKKSERVSYKDYLKKHPIPKETKQVATTKGANVPRIDAQGIADGVRGGSTANTKGGGGGKALSREEQSEFNTYISFLITELKAAHEPPPGVSDQLEARVTFDIAADGTITSPRIARSSGNRDFDESVLAAFRKVHPIGPTPNGKAETWTVTFRMKDPD
jgi:colicin import membrane protein